MWIVQLSELENGAHRNRGSDYLPEGYAVIPEGFHTPDTFPFVDIYAEELTYYKYVEDTQMVKKSRDINSFDEYGNATITVEEYEEEESSMKRVPYKMMTVISMEEKPVPENVLSDTIPTEMERIKADLDYIAAMTGVEL